MVEDVKKQGDVVAVLLIVGLLMCLFYLMWQLTEHTSLLKQIEKNTVPTVGYEAVPLGAELVEVVVGSEDIIQTWQDGIRATTKQRGIEIQQLTLSIAVLEKRIVPMEKVLVGLLKERQVAMAEAVKEEPKVERPVEAPKAEEKAK